MTSTIDSMLASLEAAKSHFGPDTARDIERMLERLSRHHFGDAKSLIRFHEALLFFRAFPPAPPIVAMTGKLLNSFHLRIGEIRKAGTDMDAFDDFDTSGIAGTSMQDTLNFEAARWLVRRIPRNVEIAWSDFEEERAMGATWPRFIPLLGEDADVEANIPWRRWLDAARGREHDLAWLLRCFERLPVTDRERGELFDSLRLPLRWHLKNLKLSRTRNWSLPRRFYFHQGPLIARGQVSLAEEFSRPAPRLSRLSRREGESIIHRIREVMLGRYRELYGTTLGDPRSVVRADLGAGEDGRGVVFYFWNLPPARRLPLRAYVAGFTVKNGVPINYVEAIGLCEWIEVGFNTFYTYRQGETAWIYAQCLRCLGALTRATTISVYPYQIGQNNEEALDSGAFWFYRKLGFRCGCPDLEQLARREEAKIGRDPQYRTPKKTLKRLAEAHVFYERAGIGKATRAINGDQSSRAVATEETSGPWDTFSTRNLGLRVNRRMAREFGGDANQVREAALRQVTRALGIHEDRIAGRTRGAWQDWSLVLSLIPDLSQWTEREKREMAEIVEARSSAGEMRYLRRTQQHPRLRRELLRLGSKG